MQHVRKFFKPLYPNIPYRLHPLDISTQAERVTNNKVPQVDLGADRYEVPGTYRWVLYDDPDNDIRQELLLKLVAHNGGAWTTIDAAARGTQSGKTEGRFVVSDGTMSVAATIAPLVKGGLFADYFVEADALPNRIAPTPVKAQSLANGDWYWVIVEGPYEYYGAAACAAGRPLGLGAVAQEGQLEDHSAVVGLGTDEAVGYCTLDPGGADAFGRCNLTLGRNGFVDTAQF